MRSNSGHDEGRNNLHDPTMRDRGLGRDVKKSMSHGRTSGMGSNHRKHAQKGNSGHR